MQQVPCCYTLLLKLWMPFVGFLASASGPVIHLPSLPTFTSAQVPCQRPVTGLQAHMYGCMDGHTNMDISHLGPIRCLVNPEEGQQLWHQLEDLVTGYPIHTSLQ